MDDRLAVREAPRMGGYAERDDSEEEKVYYGFGVFMGLPLADLRAMKDEYLQNQQHQRRANGYGNGGSHALGGERGAGPGVGADVESLPMRGVPVANSMRQAPPPQGAYDEYEMRDPMGRSHGMVRDDGRGMRGIPPSLGGMPPREMDPRMMQGNRGAPMMHHPHYGGGGAVMPVRMPPGRRGVEYDASLDDQHGRPVGGHHDDEGDSSDGSYSAPKSHSLNFILH